MCIEIKRRPKDLLSRRKRPPNARYLAMKGNVSRLQLPTEVFNTMNNLHRGINYQSTNHILFPLSWEHRRDENKLFASDAQTLIPYRMDIKRLHRRLRLPVFVQQICTRVYFGHPSIASQYWFANECFYCFFLLLGKKTLLFLPKIICNFSFIAFG